MRWIYTKLGLQMFLLFMIVLTIVGCAAVHRAVEDYQFAYSDSDTQAVVAPIANGVVMLLGSLFPEFKHFSNVIGIAVSGILTFLSGLVIGKRKRKEG